MSAACDPIEVIAAGIANGRCGTKPEAPACKMGCRFAPLTAVRAATIGRLKSTWRGPSPRRRRGRRRAGELIL